MLINIYKNKNTHLKSGQKIITHYTVDGDGKVTVNVSNEAYSDGKDLQTGVVIFNKIDAELMSGDPFVLMTDEVYIERFEKNFQA